MLFFFEQYFYGLKESMYRKMNFEIFLATTPGLETALYEEVRNKGFKKAQAVKGGVTVQGGWPDVWRANLWIRGASRILARIASFKASNLAHLDVQAREVPWHDILNPDYSFGVEVSCSKSRIYHSGAAAERIERAISESLNIQTLSKAEADIMIMVRIDRDICTISVDTSGELLHKRGYKSAVNKAPMRENMAALFLQECGYKGNEPVFDPMCGSGTFVIEAAEIAARLNPGRYRSFAFEKLVSFDPDMWEKMRHVTREPQTDSPCYGSDRDAGAIKMSKDNAHRASLDSFVSFEQKAISDICPPTQQAGLVIVNPPYGKRIGDKKKLIPLYKALGEVLKSKFSGWRVGLVTNDPSLAKETELPFLPPKAPVQHGGIRVSLFQTHPLR